MAVRQRGSATLPALRTRLSMSDASFSSLYPSFGSCTHATPHCRARQLVAAHASMVHAHTAAHASDMQSPIMCQPCKTH
eukprot:838388-Rhodomonas_salina.1